MQIRKNLLGKYEVHFECPECDEDLVELLQKAGSLDTCPSCDAEFTIPGSQELEKLQKAKRAAEKRTEQEQKEREKAREEARQKRSENRESSRQAKTTETLESRTTPDNPFEILGRDESHRNCVCPELRLWIH